MMARGILVFFLIAISVTSATATSSTNKSTPTTPSTKTSAPPTPSTTTSASTTPSTNKSTSITPSTNTSASTTPSTNKSTSTTPSTNKSTSTTPSTNKSTSTTPSTNKSTSTTPSTNKSTSTTPSTNKSSSTKPSTTTSDPTTLIPNTFYYKCTKDGVIKIRNKDNSFNNVDITYLNQSASGCSDPTSDQNGDISISGCEQSTPVNIVLEPKHKSEILGGWHSKTFQIKCDTVNIQPYFITVLAKENVGKTVSPSVIAMATTAPSLISSLSMTIKAGNNTIITDAYIGQVLTVAIHIPDGVNIKPTNCTASGNDKKVSLWQETGCIHDQELFGEKWTSASNEVTNTMYGFRFVGSSPSITISCTVRVCPEGYIGNQCDLACGKTKRKRMTKRSESVTLQTVTSSLAVRDPIMISRAGRQGCEINTIIGLSLFTLVFFKTKYFQG